MAVRWWSSNGLANDPIRRHASTRRCQQGADHDDSAWVTVDCSGSNSVASKSDAGDPSVAWLEKTLEGIDYRNHVLLCHRARKKFDSDAYGDTVTHHCEILKQEKPEPTSSSPSLFKSLFSHWRTYIDKIKGAQSCGPPKRQTALDVFWTFMVSFSVCLLLTSLEHFVVSPTRFILMIPSFAVIAALIFDNFTAPLAQPRNVICGNLIGALISCTLVQLFGIEYRWLLAPLAVSAVGALQMLTGNTHPPGGSVALYILYGPQKVRELGFLYMFTPVLVGAAFFVLAATIVLNLFSTRSFPKYWW